MISIITPSYNQGKYIERTIESVLNQAIPDLDYVVVDGGSQDATLSILKKYDAHLRFVSEKDDGQADAVNKGLKMTSADIIGWLNSDDIYYPNAIHTVLKMFDQHPEVDVIFGKANHIDEHDEFIELYPTEEWNLERFKATCFLSQPAVFFRRSLIQKTGFLNTHLNYCLDYEYWLRAALSGARFLYLPQVLAATRLYPETKTMRSPLAAQHEALQMLKQHLGYVPDEWLKKEAVVFVKSKTNLSRLEYRYIFLVTMMFVFNAFRWNGFFKGLHSVIALPKIISLRKK